MRHPGEKLRETSQRLDNLESKMKSLLVNITLEKQGRFERCVSMLKSASPLNLIQHNQNAITVYSMNLLNAMKMNIEKKKKIYLKNINTLEAVSPLSVLGR